MFRPYQNNPKKIVALAVLVVFNGLVLGYVLDRVQQTVESGGLFSANVDSWQDTIK